MKIGIQTWGSEGDVRPFLALAAGLRGAGHDVTLAVTHVENRDYAAAGEPLGVRVRRVGHLDPRLLHAAAKRLAGVSTALQQVRIILLDLFEPCARDILAAAAQLCRENDLVIGHFFLHPLHAAAERAARPRIAVFLAPLLPGRHIPPPGLPDLGGFLNGMLWKVGGAVLDRMLLPPVADLRRREGLPPVRSIVRDVYLSPVLNLVGTSLTLCPPPPDWGDRIRMCGAFTLPDLGKPAALPATVLEFLEAGPPPLYMTFGSMAGADPAPAETISLLVDAARLAGCRAIIQSDWERIARPPVEPHLLCIGPAAHDAIFPRCAAVVHHGGAGTSHAAARAGVPSVVVEHAADQAFWGGVLHRAGIAPPVLHRRRVTARELAAAIRTALGSAAMQERARRIGAAMRRERGVEQAVSLIEESMAGGRAGT